MLTFGVLLASFTFSNAVPIQIFSNGVAVSSGGLPLRQPIGQPAAPAYNRPTIPANRPTVQAINRPISPAINRPINPAIDTSLYSAPSIAFGFGSGFSSDIAGIKHSTSIGSSFSTGNGRAYGSGIGSTGSNYASGTGVADIVPTTSYFPSQPSPQRYDSYGNPVLTYDNSYIAVPAQEENTLTYYPQQTNDWSPNDNGQFQSAVSSTQNAGDLQSAVSLAQNQQGNGFQTALSATQNDNNFRSAISNAQSGDGFSNFGSATAATQNSDGLNVGTAQAIQRIGGGIQQSGATIINGPGIQAAQSHAINTGYY